MSDLLPAATGGSRSPALPNASVGPAPLAAPPIDPNAKPQMEQELGTVFDYTAGDLVFSYQPGLPENVGLVYDYREPTVGQLQEMLDHDGRAKSLEQVLAMPLIGAGWHVVPGEGNDDHETAQWVEDVLRRDTAEGGMSTSMETVIAQMTSAFTFRRSYHEKVFKQDEQNQVVYDKIAWRPPDTCTMLRDKTNGDLQGFNQWVFGKPLQVSIVLPYALVYVHGQHRNPVKGISDLQVVYHNYRTKEKLKFLWYTYCETMSLPRTIVLANSDSAAKKAAQTIAALKNAGVAGIPKEWVSEIIPLNPSTGGADEFQEAIAYLDSDSAQSLLAGFTGLASRAMGTGEGMQSGTRGSYGLSSSQIEFFMTILKAYSTELASTVTQQVVTDLVRWNKGTSVQVPQFALGPLEADDVGQAFQLLSTIAASPALNVPVDFIEELTLLIADELGMDTDSIEAAFQDFQPLSPNQRMSAASQVGADVATQAQQQMGNGTPPPNTDVVLPGRATIPAGTGT